MKYYKLTCDEYKAVVKIIKEGHITWFNIIQNSIGDICYDSDNGISFTLLDALEILSYETQGNIKYSSEKFLKELIHRVRERGCCNEC